MKKLPILAGGVGAVLSLFVLNSSSLAYSQQSQTQKVEQSVTAEVNGSGNAKVESTQKAEQSQSQSMDYQLGNMSPTGVRYSQGYIHRYKRPVSMTGQAYITWGWRGGTCHIRYTENGNGNYKYYTSAACDDGNATIGGLRPGWVYRFQVKKEDGGWGKPIRIKAS
jgi:hypothetical protein